MSQTYTIIVRAPRFHTTRRRAGRVWSVNPITVRVVEQPASDDEITPGQLAELRADPFIAVCVTPAEVAAVLEAERDRKRREADAREGYIFDDPRGLWRRDPL